MSITYVCLSVSECGLNVWSVCVCVCVCVCLSVCLSACVCGSSGCELGVYECV